MNPARANPKRLNLIRRVIYLLVGVVVVLPYIVKLPLPFRPSKDAKILFDRMKDLKKGAHVLLSFDYDPSSQAELYPMSLAVMRHCYQKGLIPIVMTHNSTGVGLAKEICEQTAAENWATCGKVLQGITFPCTRMELIRYAREKKASEGVLYVLGELSNRKYSSLEDVHSDKAVGQIPQEELQSGRDFVLLGFKTGGSSLLLNMGENLKGAFDKDFYDQPTAAMPALAGVNSLKNMAFAWDFTASDTVSMWILYGSDRYGFPLGVGTTAVQAPNLIPFVNSGQLAGYLGGLRGAADYESLVNLPGEATRGMQSQSATHLLMIVLILGANIRLLAGRLSGGRKD